MNPAATLEQVRGLCARLYALWRVHWYTSYFRPALTPQQVEHLLTTFGRPLPLALLATWQHVAEAGTCGGWGVMPGFNSHRRLEPMEALLQWRVNTCITYELRSGPARLLQEEHTLLPAQAVRHDAWNRGWFPLGQCALTERIVYVDMAPGPAGAAGQIIEAPAFLSTNRKPPHPADFRVVSPSWLHYLEAAVRLWETGVVTNANRDRLWRFASPDGDLGVYALCAHEQAAATAQASPQVAGAVEFMAASPVPQEDWGNAPPLDLTALAVRLGDEWPESDPGEFWGAEIVRRGVLPPLSYRDTEFSHPTTILDHWARDPIGAPCALIIASSGDDRTALIGQLARGLLADAADGQRVPVPLVVDVAPHASAPTLAAALDAFVHAASGQEGGGASVLGAVARGECLLVLDGVEALLATGEDAWAWCRAALPAAEPVNPSWRSGARLLVTCDLGPDPDRAQARSALAAIAPGWMSTPDLGMIL